MEARQERIVLSLHSEDDFTEDNEGDNGHRVAAPLRASARTSASSALNPGAEVEKSWDDRGFAKIGT